MERYKLEVVARIAFELGKQWAETYATWFTPTAEEHKKQEQKAIDRALAVFFNPFEKE